jgi:hypothetical protein
MTPTADIAATTNTTALALLREWQSVCDATLAGQNHLLIRKGGIAEGRDGFQVRRSFFGLLPTLFHQVKNAAPDAGVPTPPSTVSLVCQLVDTYTLPSLADLAALAPFHGYAADQLAARQNYKPDRPLNLILVRAFALRAPIEVDTTKVRPVCKSWAEVDVASGLGGIDPVVPIERSSAALDACRRAIESMGAARLINPTPD